MTEIQDTEKSAIAVAQANEALAAQYPAPENEISAAPPRITSFDAPAAYPVPVSMGDPVNVPQPATVVAMPAPVVATYPVLIWTAAPNKWMQWLVTGGARNGLCIGYGIMALLSFITMCIAGSANSPFGGMGWQIFNGLLGWLYWALLAVMYGYKPAYVFVMKIWGSTSPFIVQWVWIGTNCVLWIFWVSAVGNAAAWNYCSLYEGFYNYYWGGSCSKISAVIAFDVFVWLGTWVILTIAFLEKFAIRYTGTVGWPLVAATKPVELQKEPDVVAMSGIESSTPVTELTNDVQV